MKIKHNLDVLVGTSNNILLLQGAIGTFFHDFGQWLVRQGKAVFKINFNAGDAYFYPNQTNTFDYKDTLSHFHAYLETFCEQHQIDAIVVFGDNRPYHKIAKELARECNIEFWVFEEGYFRPEYITLEKDGVNAFSTIPRDQNYFLAQSQNLPEPLKPKVVAKGFFPMAKRAMQYYFWANLKAKDYPYYQHHREFNVGYYVYSWAKYIAKRICYAYTSWHFTKRVKRGEFGEFFIVPLQVHNDSQIVAHSDYASVADFLLEVLYSFALEAPRHLTLIIKHHPMDQRAIDYQKIIDDMIVQYPHLRQRVFYIHDVAMPVFLRYGKGMVTINSTSGISALLHNMPVRTLGRASYNFEGLTSQQSLGEFWRDPIAPKPDVFSAYRRYHLNKTQINGSFYNKVLLDD